MSKADVIRQKLQSGETIASIARELECHYSYVHQVAQRLYKGEVPESAKTKPTDSTSAKIRRMLDEGKTVSEIKKLLGLDYSFVYSVFRNYKNKKEGAN